MRTLPRMLIELAFRLPRGGYPLARWAARRFTELQTFPRKLTDFDYVMRCDVRQNVFYPLAKYGHYPHMRGELRALERLAQPDWTVLDIGANIGYMAALFARLCPDGRVYAFEPAPLCLPYLTALAKDFRNIEVIAKACADKAGTRTFDQKEEMNLSSFADEGNISVPVTTVDDWCEARGIRPSFIKIDAEGFDEAVLRGSAATLRKVRPLVMFEANTKIEHAHIAGWLKTRDYVVHQIQHDGTLSPGWSDDATRDFIAEPV
jgi:FkbM family methyltransferase